MGKMRIYNSDNPLRLKDMKYIQGDLTEADIRARLGFGTRGDFSENQRRKQ